TPAAASGTPWDASTASPRSRAPLPSGAPPPCSTARAPPFPPCPLPSRPRHRRPARPLRERTALLRVGRRRRRLSGPLPRLRHPVRVRRLLRRAARRVPLVAGQPLRRLLALCLRLQRLRARRGAPDRPLGT